MKKKTKKNSRTRGQTSKGRTDLGKGKELGGRARLPVGQVTKSSVGVIPLADRVLVLPTGRDEKVSASGIIIPETVDKERPDTGTVIAVGAGKRNDDGKLIPINVKVGQKVLFSKYGPDEIKIGGIEYYVIEEKNILAIID